MNHDEKLYRAALQKITLWCLAAIVVVSVSFYVPTYYIVVRQLENVRSNLISEFGLKSSIIEQRKKNRKEGHDNIRRQVAITLAITQSGVLILGTAGSFFFARRILRPIKKAHSAQAEFAANANHQIRTPVAAIRAELENVALKGDYSTQATKIVYASIIEEIDKLQAITEHLLAQASTTRDAAQPEATRGVGSREIRQIGDRLASVHGVRLLYVITGKPALPLSHHEAYMILDILLGNSKKYAGVPEVRSKLTVHVKQKNVELLYEDNGHGIEAKTAKHILERGRRGVEAHDTPGSGIGLSVLARLIVGHGGTVTVVPSEHGAHFVINVPGPRR
jgi:signal transduction histidine kinase